MNREVSKFPGAFWNFSQPIEDNVDETLTGTKGGLAAKLYGPDLDVLEQKGEEIKEVMSQIPGIKDLGLQRDTGEPNLDVTVDRQAAARLGINVADVQDAIQTAVGGFPVGQVLQGEAVYNLTVRYQKPYRDTKEAIQDIRILRPSGERVSLAQVAKVQVKDGAYDIYRENGSRYVAIRFEVRDRDLGTTVQEAIDKINKKVQLPRGYELKWAGEYESEKRAEARLLVIVPITILLIFIILYTMFRSAKWALLILVTVAMARVGGLVALLVTHTFFSVASGVGFLALFGVSVQTGVIMLEYINQLRARGYTVVDAAVEGAVLQAAPHHDDHAGGNFRPLAGGFLARHRIRFAAALRHRHRRRSDRRPGHEHLHPAHALRLVRERWRHTAGTGGDPLKPNRATRSFWKIRDASGCLCRIGRLRVLPRSGIRPGRQGPVQDHARRGHSDGAPAQSHLDRRCEPRSSRARPKRSRKACAPIPTLFADWEYLPLGSPAHQNPDVYTGVSTPDYLKNNTEGDIGLSYLIERGGKRQDRLQAQKDITAQTRSLVADNERGLTFQVATLFFNAQLAESTLDLAEQDLKSFQSTVDISEDQYKAGGISENDYLMIKLQLLQFESDVEQAQLARAQSLSDLRQLLGYESVSADYDVASDFEYQPVKVNLEDLQMKALQNRPDLRAAQQGVTAANSQYQLQKANGKQDVTVSGNYSHVNGINAATFLASIPLADLQSQPGRNRAGALRDHPGPRAADRGQRAGVDRRERRLRRPAIQRQSGAALYFQISGCGQAVARYQRIRLPAGRPRPARFPGRGAQLSRDRAWLSADAGLLLACARTASRSSRHGTCLSCVGLGARTSIGRPPPMSYLVEASRGCKCSARIRARPAWEPCRPTEEIGLMKKDEVRFRIQEIGIVPAIRVNRPEHAQFAAETINGAGIPIAEITMTVPGAVDVIAQLAKSLPEMVVGAGTVLDKETARRCLDAGAKFLTSPGLVLEVVEFAVKKDVVVFPGALTPTEVITAWKAGADFVKYFPVRSPAATLTSGF